jgi:choline monooxygenase
MKTSMLQADQVVAALNRPAADALALPAVAYTDPEILDIERKRLFESGWVSVAAAQQLPNPGDARPVTVAGRPLLVLRDREGQIRVFHNVCRHRGLELVTEPTQLRGGVITCAYHCWSYGLDGGLKATPYWDGTPTSSPNEATRAQLGLLPVRFAVWFDTVFVNISGDAPPFEEFIRPLAERWSGFDLSLLRLADSSDFHVDSNWKFVAENFLDLYHLPWVHSQLGKPADVFNSEITELSDDLFGYVMPMFDAARAETGSTMPLFPSLPAKLEYALDLLYVFPNTGILLAPSWAQVISIQADSPVASRESLAAYVIGDELLKEENIEARQGFVGYLHEVNDQDLKILPRLQNSRRGGATDAGRFSPRWDGLAQRLARRVARAY